MFLQSDNLTDLSGDSLYKVQLLALRTPIQIKNYFALLLSKVPGLEIIETRGEDGWYRYNNKSFRSMEAAKKYNSFIRNMGWVDSFITTSLVTEKQNK